jgi:hypothetical protein
MKFLNKVKMIIFPLSVLFIFALTACAVRTPVKQVSISEVKQNLKYENIIFGDFTVAPGVKSPEGPLIECRRSAIGYLEMKNIFKRVEKDSGQSYDEPTLFVNAILTNLRIVSGAGRFWGGAFAGRSNMNISVKLTDANGLLIAEKELIGAPSAFSSTWSFGGADSGLPQKMGFLLGDFILANVSRK